MTDRNSRSSQQDAQPHPPGRRPMRRRRAVTRRRTAITVGSLAACALLAACSSAGTVDTADTAGTTDTAGVATSSDPAAGQTQQSITLYSGQHEQTTDGLVTAFEQQTGIKVNVRNDDEDTLAT